MNIIYLRRRASEIQKRDTSFCISEPRSKQRFNTPQLAARILYIANSRIPTEKAYGVSIMKTCSALVNGGAKVTLFAPKVKNTISGDPFSFYGVPRNFVIKYIPTFDAVAWGWRYGFLLNQFSFALALFFSFSPQKGDVIITRDEVSGFLFSLTKTSVFYDMHGFPQKMLWVWKPILKMMSGIFGTNEFKIKKCQEYFNIPREKMIIARNGFDTAFFPVKEDSNILRKRFSLPIGRSIILYTGHLYDWKGVYVLLETARITPSSLFVFVGGNQWDVEAFKKEAQGISNVLILGYKPYTDIPLYLKLADVLALPNSVAPRKDSRSSGYSRDDTSPIKLFEYMASGRPIVASSLPSIREVLNEKNAILVNSDSPEDLKRGIEVALNDKEKSHTIVEQAREDVKKYTWEKRAEKIIAFIKKQTID